MKRFLLSALFLPFALAAQTSEVDFYLELVAPPLLDPVHDSVEIRNGYYLYETEALEQTPVELSPVRFDAEGQKTHPGGESSDGRPVILLEIDSLDYRTAVGVDREFGGKPCREVLVKIPLAHSGGETFRAHIFCARPTPHDADNVTVVHRYVGASETHDELIAVRIFRKSSAPPLTGGGDGKKPDISAPPTSSGSGGGAVSDGNEATHGTNGSTNGGGRVIDRSSGSGGSSDWYYNLTQLKRDAAKLKDIKDARERAAERKRIEEELAKIEDVDAAKDEVAEIKTQIEEEAPEPEYELGEDVYVEIVKPAPLSPQDSIVLDINYILNQITDAQLKAADIKMGPIPLVLEQHKTRPGDQWSGGKPYILLELGDMEFLQGLARQSMWNEKPCREVVIEAVFGNPGEKKIPAHIGVPTPNYDDDGSKQDLLIPPHKTDRVFVALRIYPKVYVEPGTMPAFFYVRHLPRFVRSRMVNAKSSTGVYINPEYAYCYKHGLITFDGTGKYTDHAMGLGTLRDEWWKVSVTALGAKYLIPEAQWDANDRKVMERRFGQWRHPYPNEDNPELVAHYKLALRQGWGFPEEGHAGENEYVRAVFDLDAIRRDIDAGILKSF